MAGHPSTREARRPWPADRAVSSLSEGRPETARSPAAVATLDRSLSLFVRRISAASVRLSRCASSSAAPRGSLTRENHREALAQAPPDAPSSAISFTARAPIRHPPYRPSPSSGSRPESKSLAGIGPRSSPGRQIRGNGGHQDQHDGTHPERERVRSLDSVEQ